MNLPISPTAASPSCGDAGGNCGKTNRRCRALRIRPALLATLAAGLAACDVPTEAPQFEQRWILPADELTVGVEELLPVDVSLSSDQSAFAVQVEPVTFQSSLGSLCSVCAPLDGQTVPKPGFDGTFSETVSLPTDVESAQVSQGVVEVEARNGMSFDPLHPPGGEPGMVTLTLREDGPGGAILDELTIDGAETSFPPSTTLSRTLSYTGGVSSDLTVAVTVSSPAGGLDPTDWVRVSLDDDLRVTATTEVLEVSSAVVGVAGRTFDLIDTNLDVGDIDREVVDRVQRGAFKLEIDNPWAIGASVTFAIMGPTMGAPILRTVDVPAQPAASLQVEFTQSELQSFLGEPNVVLVGTGVVSISANPVTITPDQALTVTVKFDLAILVG